jgi:hypothetical protein
MHNMATLCIGLQPLWLSYKIQKNRAGVTLEATVEGDPRSGLKNVMLYCHICVAIR